MQEHIRRAHPEYYIAKLPATEESFHLMVNSPPSERRNPEQSSAPAPQGLSHSQTVLTPLVDHLEAFHERNHFHRDEPSNPGTPRRIEEIGGLNTYVPPMLGTAGAAAALAELHGIKNNQDLDLDGVSPFYPAPIDNQAVVIPKRHKLTKLFRTTILIWMDDDRGPRLNCLLSTLEITTSPAILIPLPKAIASAIFSLHS